MGLRIPDLSSCRNQEKPATNDANCTNDANQEMKKMGVESHCITNRWNLGGLRRFLHREGHPCFWFSCVPLRPFASSAVKGFGCGSVALCFMGLIRVIRTI